jgi:prepilin-type N-terminal cleavage/methylation domain-containing protein
MLNNIKKRNQGFTIIEVLIVLAIAGLIILIVFLAVPTLQRNSRNTQVRNDASRVGGIVQELVNNNNGLIPMATVAPPQLLIANANYSRMGDPNYNIPTTPPRGWVALPATLVRDTGYVRSTSVCADGGGGRIAVSGGTARSVTVTYLIESPGAPAVTPTPAGFVSQCLEVN